MMAIGSLSNRAITMVCAIAIVALSAALTEAWVPASITRNARSYIHVTDTKSYNNGIMTKQKSQPSSSTSSTQLSFIRWKEPSEQDQQETVVTLTPEADAILRSSIPAMESEYGIDWFQNSSAWDTLRAQHSNELEQYTNEELELAFIKQKPTVVDLLVKTPLGAFLALNGVLFAGGFSWCDTPFHGVDACLP